MTLRDTLEAPIPTSGHRDLFTLPVSETKLLTPPQPWGIIAAIRAATPHSLTASSDSRRQTVLRLGKTRQSPPRRTAQSLRIRIGRAWRATLDLRGDEALRLVNSVERDVVGEPTDLSDPIRTELQMLRAAGLALRDESLAALSVAMPLLRQQHPYLAARIASIICRLGYWKLGDLDGFFANVRMLRADKVGKREARLAVFELSLASAVDFECLRFFAAKRFALDALTLANEYIGRQSAAAALAASLVAQVLYQEGCLGEAESMLGNYLSVVRSNGNIECGVRTYSILARIASNRGQIDLATKILQEAERLGEARDWPRLVAASIAERLEMMLLHGRLGEAEAYAQRLERLAGYYRGPDELVKSELCRYSVLGRSFVTIAREPSLDAVATLQQHQYEAACRGNLYLGLQLGIRLVDALSLVGKDDEAIEILQEALKLGVAVGLYQVFLDGGARIGRLLAVVHQLGPSGADGLDEIWPYIETLLNRQATPEGSGGSMSAGPRTGTDLTEREREVLQLISRGLSNKSIARALKITPETVKSHAKHIFAKLAVKTRAHAVSRAEDIGLI
jgi:ATP/maltotriose-dependent transcriptional regulator MalT